MNMFSHSSSVARSHLGQTHTDKNMDNDRIVNSEEYSMKDIDRNLLVIDQEYIDPLWWINQLISQVN